MSQGYARRPALRKTHVQRPGSERNRSTPRRGEERNRFTPSTRRSRGRRERIYFGFHPADARDRDPSGNPRPPDQNEKTPSGARER